VVCRKKKEKRTLIRFSTQADGSLIQDLKQKAAGRGCYVCDHPSCLQRWEDKKKKSYFKMVLAKSNGG
jgi:predicted RNA-binding protein YlxR (DUF448 family)